MKAFIFLLVMVLPVVGFAEVTTDTEKDDFDGTTTYIVEIFGHDKDGKSTTLAYRCKNSSRPRGHIFIQGSGYLGSSAGFIANFDGVVDKGIDSIYTASNSVKNAMGMESYHRSHQNLLKKISTSENAVLRMINYRDVFVGDYSFDLKGAWPAIKDAATKGGCKLPS